MVSPPPTSRRRAWTAAIWLIVTFAGLVAAVWAVGWALAGGPPPNLDTVAGATRLEYPSGTEVTDADLTGMHSPTPGSRAEATVTMPADALGTFIADNAMEAPLVVGTTPAGQATGVIPAGCNDEICYSATIVIDEDTVTVDLAVTLL